MERRQHSIVKSGVATLDTKKCHLCASEALHVYSKPSSWPEETREWVEKLCSQCFPTDAVVCRACEKYIKRHVGKANVTPRWLPKSKAHNIYCVVEGCGELSHTATSIVTYKVGQEYLDIPGVVPHLNHSLCARVTINICTGKCTTHNLVRHAPPSPGMEETTFADAQTQLG